MKKSQNDMNSLIGKNPFKVPEGYFEGLTERIMEQLPEQPHIEEEEPREVTLMDRIRPLIYLAAVFVGLGLFFKVIAPEEETLTHSKFLLVKADAEAKALVEKEYNEDEAYWEYLEEEYLEEMLMEDIENK